MFISLSLPLSLSPSPPLSVSLLLSPSLLLSLVGPEFGAEEDCVFVGMVAEDVDVPELVDTIATLGRDIEESGRVMLSIHSYYSHACMCVCFV